MPAKLSFGKRMLLTNRGSATSFHRHRGHCRTGDLCRCRGERNQGAYR